MAVKLHDVVNAANIPDEAWQALNPQQRLFLQLYLDPDNLDTYLNGYQSYRRAYPDCISPDAAYVSAHRLLSHDKIKQILADLALNREDIARNLRFAHQLAVSTKDASQIINANMSLAKLNGYLIDKSEVVNKSEAIAPDALEAELRKRGFTKVSVSADAPVSSVNKRA